MIYTVTNKVTGHEIITNNPEDVAVLLGLPEPIITMLEPGEGFDFEDVEVNCSKDAVDITKLRTQSLWR